MLYVTTRSNRDVFTAQRVLHDGRASDGGFYVPFHEPRFTPEELEGLQSFPFTHCVSVVLNKLFRTRLTARDIELAVGRQPVRMKMLNQSCVIAESWHNLDSVFSCMVKNLTHLLRSDKQVDREPGEWASVAVRIAVVYGIFGELIRSGLVDWEHPTDVAVVSGDFSAAISMWYARKWGLPIGNIVCCCNENGYIWDFIRHGQLRTDAIAKKTSTPDADVVVPDSLERLIHAFGGQQEVFRYLDAVRRGGSYYMDDNLLGYLKKGIYVTVNSEQRIMTTIPAVYATHKYLLSPYCALTYAGLQDYRSRTGESRLAVILSEKSPAYDADTVASAMGLSVDTVDKLLDFME